MKNNHGLWMLIGCLVPLMAIFLLPLFGIRGDFSIFIFIILMFGCHLFMMQGHEGHEGCGGEHGQKGEKEAKHVH